MTLKHNCWHWSLFVCVKANRSWKSILNKTGLKIEPCGTPRNISTQLLKNVVILTHVSKAYERSRNIAATNVPLSSVFFQFSVILTKLCWVLQFFPKPISNTDNLFFLKLLICVKVILSKSFWTFDTWVRLLAGLLFYFSELLSYLTIGLIHFKSLGKQLFFSERFIIFVIVLRLT